MKKSFLIFIMKRLANLPIVLLGVSILTFIFVRLVPVEPAEVILRLSRIPPTEEAVTALRAELGMDQSLIVQYMTWLKEVCRFNFGTSFVSKMPVSQEIAMKLPATMELALVAFVLIVAISILVGILSAISSNKWVDRISRSLSVIGVSIPMFWMGFILLYVFSLKLDLFPTGGKGTMMHVILPALTLAFPSIAVYTRLIRTNILEQLNEPYVFYARSRGLKTRVIILRHVLKNALIPIVPALGMTIGNLLGGAVIVEQVFGWPGLGRYLIESIVNRDYPVIQCYVLLIAVIYVLANTLGDIVHRILEPRLNKSKAGQSL